VAKRVCVLELTRGPHSPAREAGDASPDSLIPDPFSPQSLNRYGYVLNNPLRYTDPMGHRACDDFDAGGRCVTAPPAVITTVTSTGTTTTRYTTSTAGRTITTTSPFISPARTTSLSQTEQRRNDTVSTPTTEAGDGSPDVVDDASADAGDVCPADETYGMEAQYHTLQFGTAIPNPWTGTAVGWHAAITSDIYGHWYFGIGPDVGLSLFGVDVSYVGGYSTEPSEEELIDLIEGHGFEGVFAPVVSFALAGGPGQSMSGPDFPTWEIGVSTPALGGSYTYTWMIPDEWLEIIAAPSRGGR